MTDMPAHACLGFPLTGKGTMIETPRAALTGAAIAQAGAKFFSYGTNDLTQMTYGLSRDDVGRFMPTYIKEGIFIKDPFDTIDEKVR